MKRISFNQRFVNDAGNDLIKDKIHTIRQNYNFWKRFEGREIALFTWEGKPYRSKQKVFCVKRIIRVQKLNFYIYKKKTVFKNGYEETIHFQYMCNGLIFDKRKIKKLAYNDGFNFIQELNEWFENYKSGEMAIIHFTGFQY